MESIVSNTHDRLHFLFALFNLPPVMSPQSTPINSVPAQAIAAASTHIHNIVEQCFLHTAEHAAVVVYDLRCDLSVALKEAYQIALPSAQFIDFDESTPEEILAILAALSALNFVALIQTTNFRIDAFRIRVELFKRGLKVIEHPHLGRMPGQEALIYLESLAYDAQYYRGVGRALKQKIDAASRGVVDSGGEQLIFASPFESAKLNIGDYTDMANMGGQFPIGEVFTEAKDLEAVSGRVRIHVFGDTTFTVNRPDKPITLVVEKGQVTQVIDSTPEFDTVISNIIADEGVVWLRELGFGMNRAFTRERMVSDIGTYERMCGIHLSLGAKHGIYAKPNFKRGDGKYHVDVFAVTEKVMLDDEVVYQNGAWVV
jgi:aminopeptidase